jgi:hypothetical protein
MPFIVISYYTNNSFHLHEMNKLIPVFQFGSQFLLVSAPSSHKPLFLVPHCSCYLWQTPLDCAECHGFHEHSAPLQHFSLFL